MEINHLKHFVAVAEELHFGRAAIRLGMAQPPLSQSIRRLETSLGVRVFERSSHRVVMTPAGRVLLEEARRVLDQIELTERLVRRAASGELNQLRIGYAPTALFGVLPRAVRAFRKRWPGVKVLLEEMQTPQQINELRNGNLDIGLVVHHGEEFEGLSARSITRAPLVASVPTAWPVSGRRSITLAELGKFPFVLAEPNSSPGLSSPGLYAAIHAACRAAGFVPNVVQSATKVYAIMSLVANEVGVSLLPEAVRFMPVDGLTLLELDEAPADLFLETAMVWLPQAVSPITHAFIATIEDTAASIGTAPGDQGTGARRPPDVPVLV